MYILTDGKNYVVENPMSIGSYLSSTSPRHAKEFTFKQARTILQSKKKCLSWLKSYYMVNNETGEINTDFKTYSKEGIFCDEKSFEFDDEIIKTINKEVSSFVGLAAWDLEQLNTYSAMLNQGLQYYDSAISDIKHARLDKRPPAHIRTKIDGIANELEEKRRDIKQIQNYINIFIKAIKESWTISKIKIELSKAKYVPYKGRTKYFSIVEELLREY